MQRVQAVLEVDGDLKLNPRGEGVKTLPLKVAGKLLFDERIVYSRSANNNLKGELDRRSVRHYDVADATIQIGRGTLERSLDAQNRLVLTQIRNNQAIFSGINGPLTYDELQLVNVQFNSLLLDSLLPAKPVKVADTWTVPDNALAMMLNWDLVTLNQMQVTLNKVDAEIADFALEGKISGAVGGVSTEAEIVAKGNFHRQHRQITWLAATIREKRAIGHAEPGFEVTAKLRMATAPLTQSRHLDPAALAGLPLDEPLQRPPLLFRAQHSHFEIMHDPRWHMMLDRHDLCVLRFIDRGDLIAQCNISELPDAQPGKQISLEEFQADVQRSLGENFRQFAESSQFVDQGRRFLRVVATGVTSELAIQWIYYHLADQDGRQAAMAFTLEEDLVERFAEADRTLAETFRFRPRPEPTVADGPAAATANRNAASSGQ